MNKEQAWGHLYDTVFLPGLAERIEELDSFFREHRGELVDSFVDSFRKLCKMALEQQQNEGKGPIGFLHCSWLRTSILEERFVCVVEAYSARWYSDPVECMAFYDVSWAYQGFASLKGLLEQKRKLYIDMLHPPDVERMVLQYGEYIAPFIASLIRFALPDVIKLPDYQQLMKVDKLHIRAGEYFDFSEDIYVWHKEPQDAEAIRKLLTEEGNQACMYESFAGISLSSDQCRGRDFRYTDFSGSRLPNWRFEACVLAGTRWHGAMLEGADFSHSLLADADFRGANLQRAIFRGASGAGRKEPLSRVPGLLDVQFSGADLSGADFTDALLDNADFEGANLCDAVFLEKDKGRYKLSEQQIQSIRWMPSLEEIGHG
ncbi:pentapeptide repeat-containing protein [Paenibacillus sp. MMS18-CY102]|uniref:pentapeptide repeat-containing protein n=1 Tax=Paenibacillus sp. MMS18-CY102 TaxID=2682849 RepID=UPI0013666A09|nr:pentapeptide repeat-containing protein [Paenibacillus sp. MMS18-CY102]MWC30007.1 pentapeptide repeat-containing protein [Paenibacillus sp. MMS18-CY102]